MPTNARSGVIWQTDPESEAVLEAAWHAAWADFLSNRIAHAERRAAPFLLSLPSVLDAARSQAPLCRSEDQEDGDEALANRLVTLADMAHIAGAARADAAVLALAVDAYDCHLARRPSNTGAMRMRAETLLRCRRYDEAFEGFQQLYERSLGDHAATSAPLPVRQGAAADEPVLAASGSAAATSSAVAPASASSSSSGEVAPFQLLHDAECIEHAVELGAPSSALSMAVAWRELAAQLTTAAATSDGDPRHADTASTRYVGVRALSAAHRALLGKQHGQPLPLPPARALAPARGPCSSLPVPVPVPVPVALRDGIDWSAACSTYASKRLLVVDDLLSASALAELQAYTQHGAHFRTLRKGYLGAFPADGTTHPLILCLARELHARAAPIFGEHALAMWWIFKYDSTINPKGIGIHADPAAVNINLWLTDDDACLEGGGLQIYSHVPPLEASTPQVNHEFKSRGEEERLREELTAAGAVTTIPYRCNRACIFVSDQYHESLPFRFETGYPQRRANLTLLFGDRWSPLPPVPAAQRGAPGGQGPCGAESAAPSAGCGAGAGATNTAAGATVATANATPPAPSGDDGWDVFD